MLSLFLWKHQTKLLQRALHGGCIIRLRSELIYRFFIVWYSWLYLKIRTLLADTMCILMLSEHLALTEFWRPRTILSDRLLLYDIWRQVTNPPGILDAKAVGSAPLLRLNSLSRKFLHLLTVCRQPSLRITSFIFPETRGECPPFSTTALDPFRIPSGYLSRFSRVSQHAACMRRTCYDRQEL